MNRRERKRRLVWAVSGGIVIAVLLTVVICNWDKILDPERFFVNENDYRAEIAAAAKKHGLDPALVRALIYQESRFKADKRGKRGEIGLMQVLPSGAAAEWARVNKRPRPTERELFDVGVNLEIGCWYLARAMRNWRSYDRRVELALAEYNAGPTNARKWAPPQKNGQVLPRVTIASTKKYITEIVKRWRAYSGAN